jgi:hypothetical protein
VGRLRTGWTGMVSKLQSSGTLSAHSFSGTEITPATGRLAMEMRKK